MRTIKFRGKRLDNGEWVYGFLTCYAEKVAAIQHWNKKGHLTGYGTDPESVGQWTGLVDRHGKEIYEGDIVILETVSRHRSLGCVRWTDFARYEFWHLRQDQGFQLGQRFDETEIIGNIHDNPELMEV